MTDDPEPTAAPGSTRTCFVMMPFGLPFDRYYRNIFVPAIQEAGLQPVRGDEVFGPSAILGDIWNLLSGSAIGLADLSGRNANVFYELGLAHATGKPVILVTSNLGDVPFDLSGLRVIVYDKNDEDWGTTLRGNIRQSIRQVLVDPKRAVPSPFIQHVNPEYLSASAVEIEIRQLATEMRAIGQSVSAALNSGTQRSGAAGDSMDQIIAAVFPRARSLNLNWGQTCHVIEQLRSGLKSEAVQYVIATGVTRPQAESVVEFIEGHL